MPKERQPESATPAIARRPTAIILGVILLLVASYQAVQLLTSEGLGWTKAAWRTRHMNGLQRSARFYLGSSGAQFMQFLDRTIPESAQFTSLCRTFYSFTSYPGPLSPVAVIPWFSKTCQKNAWRASGMKSATFPQ